VLAYNLKRVMNIMGIGPLIVAMSAANALVGLHLHLYPAKSSPRTPKPGSSNLVSQSNRQNRKNHRDRPSKLTGPSHRHNNERFYTAWTL
jgi:hypothetical protein